MSDNLNKSIQDKGWTEMSALLDKEMPQEKKKRRAILWFYFLGAAVLGLVVFATVLAPGNYMKRNIVQDKAPISENIHEDKILNKDEMIVNEEEKVVEGSDSEQQEPIGIDERNEAEEAKVNLGSTPIETNQNINTPGKILTPNPETNSENIVEEEKLIAVANQDELTKNNISEVNEDVIGDSAIVEEVIIASEDQAEGERNLVKSLLTPVQSLPINDRNMFSLTRTSNMIIPPVVIQPLKKEYTFSPYAMATGLYQSKLGALGYGWGIGLDYGNNDFSLYTEMAYIRSNYRGEDSNDSRIYDDASFEVLGDQGAFPTFSASNIAVELDNFSTVTKRTNELRFDFGMRKTIFRNYSLVGGIAYSRITTIENEEFDISLDEVTMENDLDHVYSINKAALQDAGVFNRYDIIPHVGLEWNITKNLFLGADYNYGLINLISETSLENFSSSREDESIYRRNGALKLRYTF